MAKMYYSLQETMEKLGCDEAQVRAFVGEGKLREFRDGGKLNYQVDEVDRLASEIAGGGVSLEDSGELSLADSGELSLAPEDSGTDTGGKDEKDAGGSDTGIPLSDSDTGILSLEDSGTGGDPSASTDMPAPADSDAPAGGSKSGTKSGSGVLTLEDSGPISMEDSSGDAISLDEVDKDAVSGMKKDDTVITNIGISVFDDDDLEIAADPMAKTLMTGGDEDLRLDGSGGGSGLLDLTRESDDTSLGAELLEGIDMGDSGEAMPAAAAQKPESEVEMADEMEESDIEPSFVAAAPSQQMVGVVEAASPAFTGLLIAAALSMVLLGATVAAMSLKAYPTYMGMMAENFYAVLGGLLGLGGLCALIGYFVGQQSGRPKSAKGPKAKKDKKSRKKGKKGKQADEAEPAEPEGGEEEVLDLDDLDV